MPGARRDPLAGRLILAFLCLLAVMVVGVDQSLTRSLREPAAVATLRAALAWVFLAASALAILAAVRLSASFNRPLKEMTRLVERLAGGDYAVRLRDLPDDERGGLGVALNGLAERIQRTVEELSRDRAQLSTILSNIVEAVVAINSEGRILAVNPALCALFSVSPKDALGRPLLP